MTGADVTDASARQRRQRGQRSTTILIDTVPLTATTPRADDRGVRKLPILGAFAVGAIITASGFVFWPDSDSSPHLNPDDARAIAAASLHERGTVTCDPARFRSNGVWLVTCTVMPTSTHSDVRPSPQRYLMLVNDDTGKLIDYTP